MVTTLHIRIEPIGEFDDRVAETLRAIEEGRVAELDGDPVLSVPDDETLERVLTGKNLELIRTTARAKPASLRELARHLDRDIKNVSRAANRLAELGLVELHERGRAKQPRIPYDELEVTYQIRGNSGSSELTA